MSSEELKWFQMWKPSKKIFWGKMYVPGKHIIDPAPKTKKKEGKISSIVLCVQFCVCRKMGFKIWHHSKAASALLREKCPNWRNLARGSAPVQKQILIFLKNSFSKPTKMQSSQTCIFWPKPTPPPTFTRAGTKNCEFELPKKTIALQVFSKIGLCVTKSSNGHFLVF